MSSSALAAVTTEAKLLYQLSTLSSAADVHSVDSVMAGEGEYVFARLGADWQVSRSKLCRNNHLGRQQRRTPREPVTHACLCTTGAME